MKQASWSILVTTIGFIMNLTNVALNKKALYLFLVIFLCFVENKRL